MVFILVGLFLNFVLESRNKFSACELYVLRKFCAKTRGGHAVVLNDVHFDVVLSDFILPPKGHLFAKHTNVETFYKMGFPKKQKIKDVLFCAW